MHAGHLAELGHQFGHETVRGKVSRFHQAADAYFAIFSVWPALADSIAVKITSKDR